MHVTPALASRRQIAAYIQVASVDARWTFWLIYYVSMSPPTHLRCHGRSAGHRVRSGVQTVGRQVTWSPHGTPRGVAMRSPPVPPAP